MTARSIGGTDRAAADRTRRLLEFLEAGPALAEGGRGTVLRRIGEADLKRFRVAPDELDGLARGGLVARLPTGEWALTAAGLARLARPGSTLAGPSGSHLAAARRIVAETRPDPAGGVSTLLVDEAESPLGWLGRRRDRDGRPLIETHELAAGERLRSDFTRAGLMPALTSNWRALAAPSGGGRGGIADLADAAVAARERFGRAVQAMGPELGGLVVDVCCFLKGLETVEAERRWPARSAKIVLRIALARLAEHYGIAAVATGPDQAPMARWGAPDYRPAVTPPP